MIDLIVAGTGEVTQKYLWDAVRSKNPDLGMRIATVIDIKDQSDLSPRMQDVLERSGAEYLRMKNGVLSGKLLFSKNSVAIVMTPQDSHLFYASYFTNMGLKTLVEKPAVSSLAEMSEFEDLARKRKGLLYCAECCADGKGLGLLLASGKIEEVDPRFGYIEVSPKTERADVVAIFKKLGRLKRIDGRMLEGSGTRGVVDHRPWILEGRCGGMIRELSSHLFAPIFDAGLIYNGPHSGNPGTLAKTSLGRYEPGSPLGTFRPLQSSDEGETWGKITGYFLACDEKTQLGVPFEFRVGKYWHQNERSLLLIFENGEARLNYERPYDFTFRVEGQTAISAKINTDHYPLMLLDFLSFVNGKNDGHVLRGVETVRFNERVRAIGVSRLRMIENARISRFDEE